MAAERVPDEDQRAIWIVSRFRVAECVRKSFLYLVVGGILSVPCLLVRGRIPKAFHYKTTVPIIDDVGGGLRLLEIELGPTADDVGPEDRLVLGILPEPSRKRLAQHLPHRNGIVEAGSVDPVDKDNGNVARHRVPPDSSP